MLTPATPSELSHRLGVIMKGMRSVLAFRAARDPATAAILLLLWGRLGNVLARFSAIAARYRAGTLRATPATRRGPASPPHPPPRDVLPRHRAWVLRYAPECAAYGENLRWLLAEPELAAMIQAAPQLRRLLRPLWRMLQAGPPPPPLRTPATAPEPASRRPRPGARPASPTARAAPHAMPRTAGPPSHRTLDRG